MTDHSYPAVRPASELPRTGARLARLRAFRQGRLPRVGELDPHDGPFVPGCEAGERLPAARLDGSRMVGGAWGAILFLMGPRIAVVGSGPAGLFAVEALLKQRAEAHVDVFERLPAPYGLLRYGVAPDHLKIKSLEAGFRKTLSDPRVRFFGNVELGRDVHVEDLLASYDAIVYAVGAPNDRRLGIAGEDLPGSLASTEFVRWYGGHPETKTSPV